MDNERGATVKFNAHDPPFAMELFKGFDDPILKPSAIINVSINPPEKDWKESGEYEYPVLVQAEEAADYQIAVNKWLKPRFADLRSPRATIFAPYDGQRISPEVFKGDKKFKIEAFSDDHDIAKVTIEYRDKKTDGVWGEWKILPGLVWEDGKDSANVNVEYEMHGAYGNEPYYIRRRTFTFEWPDAGIENLGVGEYAFRAIAQDKATELDTDGITQSPRPNIDLDPPVVTIQVDGSKPTVLTTTPDYQASEKERIYRGELSAIFNDDMRADDFNDLTFYVSDLLNNGDKVAGFVSYSPALRKVIFVPVVPFDPNGFFRVEIKTDSVKEIDGKPVEENGVHDLAGNPLDDTFMFTFRTTDTPFEETWSITLAATDGITTDANNIAAIEYGALDLEDEQDALAVPSLTSQLRLSFVDRDKIEFDRDVRPADGRLSHHWYFIVANAEPGQKVKISWQPSKKLEKDDRQYQKIQLVEFKPDGSPNPPIPLELNKTLAYEYTPADNEASRFFRLDVQKTLSFVASEFQKGSTGWKFFSVPIKPQRADPFVNLGDDIEPFKMYQYYTQLNGYKIYPLDLGEVSLLTGQGYFTRLEKTAQIDVGGAVNNTNMTVTLKEPGWHAIGNPFAKPVAVYSLIVNDKNFAEASALVEATLYRWKIDAVGTDAYEAVTSDGQLEPWDGYWLKTKAENIQLTFPAPSGMNTFIIPLPDIYNPPMAPPMRNDSIVGKGQFNLKLALTSDYASDLTTMLGTRVDAKVGLDEFDTSEPPTLSKTVAVYFRHKDWGDDSGLYNTDYQPLLNIGESCTWQFEVYTDKPDANMWLSWEDVIEQVPPDIMLTFREIDNQSENDTQHATQSTFQDMRQVRFVNLNTKQFITKKRFEVRAERIKIAPLAELNAFDAGNQVLLRWKSEPNEAITGYTISKRQESRKAGKPEQVFDTQYATHNTQYKFIDTDVIEKETYTYQIVTHFKTGATLPGELLTVTLSNPLRDLKVIAGEKQVRLQWAEDLNPFIDSYLITRHQGAQANWKETEPTQYTLVHQTGKPVSTFVDTEVEEEADYTYQVEVLYKNGNRLKSKLFTVIVLPFVKGTVLLQCYPNPFNPETWIPYELDRESEVKILIYNIGGQLIRTLDFSGQPRGRYLSKEKSAYWDGRNEFGERSASGIYFYVMKAGKFTATRKMVLFK